MFLDVNDKAIIVKAGEISGFRCTYFNPYGKRNTPPELPKTPLIYTELKNSYGTNIKVSPQFQLWLDSELQRREAIAKSMESPQLEISDLYDHQIVGVQGMLAMNGKVLLGDDPRLGKTVQSLALADKSVYPQPLYIFTLKSLMWQWAEEVATWSHYVPVIATGPAKERLKLLGESEPGRAYITNWETLRMNSEDCCGKNIDPKFLRRAKNIIGDECHIVRNRKAQVTKNFTKLNPEFAVLMSATMLENGPQDYFTLLRMLRPKEFNSYWRWVHWYNRTQYNGFGMDIKEPINEDILADHLAPFSIRRSIHDVHNIPDKVYQNISVQITPEIAELYDKIRTEIVIELANDETLIVPNVLSKTIRLRRLGVEPEYFGIFETSPKLIAAMDIIDGLPTEFQVVVYSSFRNPLTELALELNKRGSTAAVYIGGDDKSVVDNFKDGQFKVLCTTPQVGGVGLDLSNASAIIYLDLPNSSTQYRQSIARTTKIGVSEPRLVYTILMTGIDYALQGALTQKLNVISQTNIATHILEYLGVE